MMLLLSMCDFQGDVSVGHLSSDYHWLYFDWGLAGSFPYSSRLGQTLAG